MSSSSRRIALCALAAASLLAPSSASATSTPKQIKAAKAAGVKYLESLQQPDGSFETDWVLGALAAAGTAPATVKPGPSAPDARSWYRALIGNPATWPGGTEAVTEFERASLNTYAAGIDPARVSATQNLIARIVARYQPSAPGYYGSPTNFGGAVFGLLALAETRTRSGALRVPASLLEKSMTVVRANQHTDGGWGFERAEGNAKKLAEPSEPDETGAAIAGLCAAGASSSDPAIANARAYLEADLVASTGAFKAPFGDNTDSNAWAVQGLDVCGIDPQGTGFTSAQAKTPIDFLLSNQLAGGAFTYEHGEAEGNEYSSQDGLRSISGAGFTTAPAGAKGAPKWVFQSAFTAGVGSPLALILNTGAGPLQVCSVTVTPSGSTTTLGALLEAAQASSTPSGCVTSVQPTSGKGAITQIDGAPSPAEARWKISVDGGKAKAAKRSTKITVGDTVSLTLS